MPSGVYMAGFFLVLVGVIILGLRFFAPSALTYLVTPVWQFGNAITNGLHTYGSALADKEDLVRERDMLIAENQALEESNRGLSSQVQDLSHLVGSRSVSAVRILAGVLARPPTVPYDTFIVDRGTDGGVVPGAFVFAPGGVPIGTVESAERTTARIALFSAPGKISEGWVGEKRIPITLTGLGTGAFSASLPRESSVAVGDIVYLPGPGALPVGTIVRVDTDPSSPRALVHVAPYINLFSLTWLEIAP